MLNRRFIKHSLPMNPEGSLNQLAINGFLLSSKDPLWNHQNLTGRDIASRQSLIDLLNHLDHPSKASLRTFLTEFDLDNVEDMAVLDFYSSRFTAVIKTALNGEEWQQGSQFQRSLAKQWQSIKTLTLSGGLTSHGFGLALAESVESQLQGIDVINSPWGGMTALFGLAQTVAHTDDILVMDFGATGIKRGVAKKYGNRIKLLSELKVSQFKVSGLIRKEAFLEILSNTFDLIGRPLPVAISLACYMENGHPFDYRSGIYHRLEEDAPHLADTMHFDWLPSVGFQGLALLEHDSTAAALAFHFKSSAMMVTLGTGLGSAPCPSLST
jgi:hypothetical protein